MPSIITASTASNTALNFSADTSGVLEIRTGSSPTTAMTIDTSQNVGIGTASPATKIEITNGKLQVNTGGSLGFAGTGGINLFSGTGAEIRLYDNSNSCGINTVPSGGASSLAFSTSGTTERMRIDSVGRIAIGTSSFVGNEQVNISFNSAVATTTQALNTKDTNASAINNAHIVLRRSDDTYLGSIGRAGADTAMFLDGNSYLSLRTSSTERVRISANGSRQFTTQNANTIYAGDATFTLSNSTVTFDLATVFPDLVGNGAGMGIMLLINQWSGAPNTGITQLTLGQKSSGWTFSTIATTGSGTGSSVSGSGTVITVTSGSGFGQIRVWVTSRN